MKMGEFVKRSGRYLAVGLAMMVLVSNFNLPRRNSKWADFEKIKPGMTKTEVESIMGETEIYLASGVAGPFALGWNVEATLFSDEYCLTASVQLQDNNGAYTTLGFSNDVRTLACCTNPENENHELDKGDLPLIDSPTGPIRHPPS